MSLLLLEEVKETIQKEIWDKELTDFYLKTIDEYYNKEHGIYYKNENGDIYINSNLFAHFRYSYRKQFKINKKIFLPKFNEINIQFEERFIIENGVEINYELSNFKKSIDIKSKKIMEEKEKYNEKIKYNKLVNNESKKLNKDKKINKKVLKMQEKNNMLKNAINKNKNILSFDMEMHEKNQKKILEIGYSFYDGETKQYENKNLVIKENLHLKNGKYVDDNKFMFMFGETLFISEKEAYEILYSKIDKADVFVGHSLKNDLKFIQHSKKNKIQSFDTSMIRFGDVNSIDFGKTPSLKDLSTTLGLEPEFLHNAGNDAYYTLQSAFKIISK